jgi:Tol biopolymer transport system component
MTDTEDHLRRTLASHLDPIEVPRPLPSGIQTRARRDRMVLIGVSALALVAVAVTGSLVLPSFQTKVQRPDGVIARPPAVIPTPHEIVPRKNGLIAYSQSTSSGTELHSVRSDGTDDRIIPTPPGLPWHHAWSPDGSKLAVSIFPVGAGERTFWIMNADGSDAHQVAAAENVSAPSWSPDGKTIVYSARMDGRTEIHLVGADGSNDRVLHGEEAEGTFAIFSAQFSPDGTEILFDRGTDSEFDIFVMSVDGTNLRPLTTTGTDYDPHWSPDGTQIAFTRQEIVKSAGQRVATSDIFLMNADGDDVRRLTDGGSRSTNLNPHWAPDASKIVYVGGVTGGPGGLVVMNPDGSAPNQLVADGVLGVSWQPR